MALQGLCFETFYLIIGEIQNVILKADCHNILIAGDLNTDFFRNSRFVQIVRTFVENLNLKVFWSNPDPSPNHKIDNISFTHHSSIRNMDYFPQLTTL